MVSAVGCVPGNWAESRDACGECVVRALRAYVLFDSEWAAASSERADVWMCTQLSSARHCLAVERCVQQLADAQIAPSVVQRPGAYVARCLSRGVWAHREGSVIV